MAQSNCGRGGRMAPPGSNKRMGAKQVSCQDFVITIREGRHQFSWHKKQERLRISPSDTVMVLTPIKRASIPASARSRRQRTCCWWERPFTATDCGSPSWPVCCRKVASGNCGRTFSWDLLGSNNVTAVGPAISKGRSQRASLRILVQMQLARGRDLRRQHGQHRCPQSAPPRGAFGCDGGM